MTTTGFTSAVEHRDDPSLLVIRARDETSLLNVASDLGFAPEAVYPSFTSGQPHRMIVQKVSYWQWVLVQGIRIAYDGQPQQVPPPCQERGTPAGIPRWMFRSEASADHSASASSRFSVISSPVS